MLVTKQAPDFTATTVLADGSIVEDFKLSENYGEKGTVLFFYPLDFTFVCPSEIIAFSKRVADFKERGVNVIGVSVDSQFSHFAWRETAVNEGGIGRVNMPLVADLTKNIARAYDVLLDDAVALRGSFLIDADGTIRHAVINDLPLGRNIDEMLRTIDALAFHTANGDVCPAGWKNGDSGMNPSHEGMKSYVAENADKL